MLDPTTVSRAGAIMFAVAVTAVDGANTVNQALADQWTPDTVVLVACAVALAAVVPSYLRTAIDRRDVPTATLLAVTFCVAAAVSCSLTLKRAASNVERQQHATATSNWPLVLAEREVAAAEAEAAKVAAQTVAQMQRVKAAETAMQTALTDPAAPGKGPQYREAQRDRDAHAAKLAAVESARRDATGRLQAARAARVALGPPRPDVYRGLGPLVSAALSLLALPAAIGLFMFASSPPTERELARNASTGSAAQQCATASNSAALNGVTCKALHVTSSSIGNTTDSPGNIDVLRGVEANGAALSEAPRSSTAQHHPPDAKRAAGLTTQGDVVRAILKETIRRAAERGETADFDRHAPRWKECQDRYGYSSSTITKYRKAARKQFMRAARAA